MKIHRESQKNALSVIKTQENAYRCILLFV